MYKFLVFLIQLAKVSEMNLKAIYNDFKNDLILIEQDLVRSLRTSQETLRDASLHPLEAGGKRLRPLFVLLAGRLGEYHFDRLQSLATSMELIHMATLVHDDVIDNASLRRGRKTVRTFWDDQVAMISGDFTFSRALERLGQLKNPLIHQKLSSALLQMCKGEILQFQDLFNKNQSLRHYLHRIKRKTAILFAISCQLGALVSEAKPNIIREITAYGYYVGMAFQLIDDTLDFEGDVGVIGKPVGNDLRQGNVTLPVIYALEQAQKEERIKIERFLDSDGKDGYIEDIISIVHSVGGIQFSKNLANRYLHKAICATHKLPKNTTQYTLQWIANSLANRSY